MSDLAYDIQKTFWDVYDKRESRLKEKDILFNELLIKAIARLSIKTKD